MAKQVDSGRDWQKGHFYLGENFGYNFEQVDSFKVIFSSESQVFL